MAPPGFIPNVCKQSYEVSGGVFHAVCHGSETAINLRMALHAVFYCRGVVRASLMLSGPTQPACNSGSRTRILVLLCQTLRPIPASVGAHCYLVFRRMYIPSERSRASFLLALLRGNNFRIRKMRQVP
jgi:hypothetical protein